MFHCRYRRTGSEHPAAEYLRPFRVSRAQFVNTQEHFYFGGIFRCAFIATLHGDQQGAIVDFQALMSFDLTDPCSNFIQGA